MEGFFSVTELSRVFDHIPFFDRMGMETIALPDALNRILYADVT